LRHRRDGRREWTARFAALLLVVQAVLLAFSTGAIAEPVVRDQFGYVICSPGAMSGHHGSSSHDRHGGGFDCCTVGCPMFGGLASTPAPIAAQPDRPSASAVRFALNENAAAAGVPPSPRSAQGPPLSA
jgi:hypothetical protein